MKSDISKEVEGINTYEEKLNIKEEDKIIFELPKENSLRTLIKYKKLEKTSLKFPRKYNEIKKKNL